MRRRQTWNFEKWGEGRPFPLVAMAQAVALGAEACYEACRMARDMERADGEECPLPVEQWQAYYADEPGLLNSVTGRLAVGPDEAEGLQVLAGLGEGLGAVMQMGEEERKARVEATMKELGISDFKSLAEVAEGLGDEMRREHMEELREMVAPEKPVPPDFRERLGSPEVLFFFRVWFPCWIEYGVKLPVLVAQAKAGDLKALCKLLRLDKSALEIPEVRQHYHARIGEKGAFRALNSALAGKPLRKLTRSKVKITLAAYVYKMFARADAKFRDLEKALEVQGMKVPQPVVKLAPMDVHALFDSAAKYEHDAVRDRDLPLNGHAFYMALMREVPFWPDLG